MIREIKKSIRAYSTSMSFLVLVLGLATLPAYCLEQSSENKKDVEVTGDQKSDIKFTFKDVPVKCVNPNSACEESKKVIKTLMKISKAYSHGDFKTFGDYLDDEVTILDKRTKKVISGKDAVLKDVKRRWKDAHKGPKPVISYTIEHPYAKVMGDTAVVTFKAIKIIGGKKKPRKYVSKSTDIFVKKDGEWKKLHYISNWKKVRS